MSFICLTTMKKMGMNKWFVNCHIMGHHIDYISTFDHTLKDDEGGFSLQVSVFHQTSLGRRAVSQTTDVGLDGLATMFYLGCKHNSGVSLAAIGVRASKLIA